MLVGTLQPDTGTVRFDGGSIGDDLTGAKRRLGYLPESTALYSEMVAEYLDFVAEYLDFVAGLRNLSGADRTGRGRRASGRMTRKMWSPVSMSVLPRGGMTSSPLAILGCRGSVERYENQSGHA